MDGKRQHLLTGRNANETPFTRLARSTLAEPRRSPEPFLKSGNASSIITRYTVTTSHAANRLIVTGGWPMTWVHYHVTGGRHLPRRDPGHFRQQDKREAMRLLKTWIKTGHG
jgi:hypothetical protein